MKNITKDELKIILKDHKRWLSLTDYGGKRADLKGADLSGVDLSGADLRGAILRGADLIGADLRGAILFGAYLSGADLREADLRGADLRGADLRGADLRGALVEANLLKEVDIRGTDFDEDSLPLELVTRFFPLACPEEGSFTAWKKCGKYIVKLRIPEDALRSSAFDRKCRASKAECLEIQNVDGTQSGITEVKSAYDEKFVYRVGRMSFVSNFDTDRTKECAPGIHFFITRQEAVNYR